MPRLKDTYKAEIIPAMMQKFSYKNIMQVPKLEKVVINMGMGDIKALVPLMVVNPSCALIAFAVGLLALALAGLLLHRRALPFLPFLTLGWLLMGCLGTCSV